MPDRYLEIKTSHDGPRIPLEGQLELTHRCNNDCRHCWLRIPAGSPEKKKELSVQEIKRIVDEAYDLGCRTWDISGGEPMLRPDFFELFELVTRRFNSYSLNTNGTLITPKIARLMKRRGVKLVALYGATGKVHDHITRNPGSFEQTMRGCRYLKEAGAGFTVQLVPMRDNYHQFEDMLSLAASLSRHYRVGAAWLYLSARADRTRNEEILRQRLDPRQVVELDKPDLSSDPLQETSRLACRPALNTDCLFSACIESRRTFHIDPYAQASFCCFVRDPALRYDLRKGSLRECWEEFIPSLERKVKATREYRKNCGSCALRSDCRWCPVYGYLEHRRFSAKVDYLCAVARQNRKFKQSWRKNHRRYFSIAGITIRVDSDLPFTAQTFDRKLSRFKTSGPGKDTISLSHHFFPPDIKDSRQLGEEVYRRRPWAVYKNRDCWFYLGILSKSKDKNLQRVAVFNFDHTRARIYTYDKNIFLEGGLPSLTMFPTDQILIARILADRQGLILHSCGVELGGKGLLFAGHSSAGKSTMARMLKAKARILCDDRIILRRSPEGFTIHGTWFSGDMPANSNRSAPLSAILFLKQAKENRLVPLADPRETARRLLSCVIRPLVTADWWDKTLSLVERIVDQVPCYVLEFEKSGAVKELLKKV